MALLGTWRAVREECDEDSIATPSKAPETVLTLSAGGRYRRSGDKGVSGSFTIESVGDLNFVQLDEAAMLEHYLVRNGQLELTGEGEAAYPCITVLERKR